MKTSTFTDTAAGPAGTPMARSLPADPSLHPPARSNQDTTMNRIAPLAPPGPDLWEPDSPRPPDPEAPAPRAPVARCADGHGSMTGLFFSDDVVDIARAKAMCARCPLTESCLAGALEREEPWGVWGGELLSGGRIVANKRPCGRPPKRPRPEIVYDELGPVGVLA